MKFVGNSLSHQPLHGLFQLAKTNGLLSEAAYFMLLKQSGKGAFSVMCLPEVG